MAGPETSAQPDGETGTRGWYIYGIVPGDVETNGGARGIGDATVEVVRHGDIAALVSEIDTSQPLGRPEDLMAHQQLLDAAAPEAPILPLRFGAVVSERDAVAGELLAPHHDEFAEALGELEGSVEYLVKGRYDERAVLHEILSENTEAARLRDAIRAANDEAATRNERIRLGELINQAVAAKRDEDTSAFADAVAPYQRAGSVREPTHELDAVHMALLIETTGQDDLKRAVEQVARDWAGRVHLRLLGPMAPYDFVTPPQPEG